MPDVCLLYFIYISSLHSYVSPGKFQVSKGAVERREEFPFQ